MANPHPVPNPKGRPKGTPNRKTREVQDILAKLKCDPIAGMAKIALNPKHSPELRGKMHAELAKYVYPQRKAVEHSGDLQHSGEGGGPIRFVVERIGTEATKGD